MGRWQRESPLLASVPVRVDVAVDAKPNLRAINDRSARFGSLLFDRVEGAAENFKRKIFLLEGSEKSTECELLVDVLLDVFVKQRGALQIPLRILWIWDRGE